MSLKGKVMLVTGGGTGIGLMIAHGFAQEGAKVYITGRRSDVLHKAVDAYSGPGKLVALAMDVTNPADIASAVKQVEKEDGKLDVLVNNAGVVVPQNDPNFVESVQARVAEGKSTYDLETFGGFESIFKSNTAAPYFVTVGFLDLLTKGAEARKGIEGDETSVVINISSSAAHLRHPPAISTTSYPLSKAALELLTVQLSARFAKDKLPIRVNAISPGIFPTDLAPPEFWEWMRTTTLPGLVTPDPLGRLGRKDEMAKTANYLATNSYVNGSILTLHGGFTLLNP